METPWFLLAIQPSASRPVPQRGAEVRAEHRLAAPEAHAHRAAGDVSHHDTRVDDGHLGGCGKVDGKQGWQGGIRGVGVE